MAYGATGSGKTHTVTQLAQRAAGELERQADVRQTGNRPAKRCVPGVSRVLKVPENDGYDWYLLMVWVMSHVQAPFS